eukprot:Rmarinus@m.18820
MMRASFVFGLLIAFTYFHGAVADSATGSCHHNCADVAETIHGQSIVHAAFGDDIVAMDLAQNEVACYTDYAECPFDSTPCDCYTYPADPPCMVCIPDLCAGANHGCDVNAVCENIWNTTTFEADRDCVCNEGWHGSGEVCLDDDECADMTHDCNVAATCTNLPGAFNCSCDTHSNGVAGPTGDGYTCRVRYEIELHTANKQGAQTNDLLTITLNLDDGASTEVFTTVDLGWDSMPKGSIQIEEHVANHEQFKSLDSVNIAIDGTDYWAPSRIIVRDLTYGQEFDSGWIRYYT